MNTLNIWLIRLNIVVWGAFILISLKGCGGSDTRQTDTGHLTCLGYCELNIDRSESESIVHADGTVIERSGTKGITSDNLHRPDEE